MLTENGKEVSSEVMKRLLDKYREKQSNSREEKMEENIEPMTFTLDPSQVKQMNAFVEKHNRSRKCFINKRIREHRKKGVFPCGGHCQYSLEITFSSIANLASIKCECGEEQYLGEV